MNVNVDADVIEEEDSGVVEGILWKEVRQNNKFLEATKLLDIWYDMQPQTETTLLWREYIPFYKR